jgi:hypothetical protein
MSGARLRWERAGEARVVSIGADAVALCSNVPFPPGARVSGALVDDASLVVRVKVHSCRRRTEGDYWVEGRPIDLPRSVRERLERDCTG